MKKILVLSAILFVSGSCKKAVLDPAAACEKAAEAYTNSISAYVTNPTNVKNCQAFIAAAKTFINDCPTISAADKKNAEASLATVKCN